ncbi:MAG: flagellar protein FlaG [Spirochaetia bacterium]
MSTRVADQKMAVAKIHAGQQESDKKRAAAVQEAQKKMQDAKSTDDTERYLKDILRLTGLFNRKLKFRINNDLQQVIVKVVDKETDKVIKEIPPEALQRLHERMQEFIGLLIDEEI